MSLADVRHLCPCRRAVYSRLAIFHLPSFLVADSALESLHRVEVASDVEVSGVYAASIFRVEVSMVS
jgi:hypothetical protein